MSTSSNPSLANIVRLIVWTHDPTCEPLAELLARLSDDDLRFAMVSTVSPSSARIAWAEYGRRRGFVNFELAVVESQGSVDVHFRGSAVPAHEAPVYGADVPKGLIPRL